MRIGHAIVLASTLVASVRAASAQPTGGSTPDGEATAAPDSPATPALGQPITPADPAAPSSTAHSEDPVPPVVEPSKPSAVATTPDPLAPAVITAGPAGPAATPAVPATGRGFRFGSYGRIIAGTDLRGGKPESANVVAFGPRIVEPSYLELDLSYGFITPRGMQLRPVVTLAFDGTLFHDTGDFDAKPAIRNAYLDAGITTHLTAWVGSRMYRGDDIYLFSYWPLDDQNTVGGGLYYRRAAHEAQGGDVLELALHGGVNRLNRDYQFQQIDVANPAQGSVTVTQLDRQRFVASATAAYILAGAATGPSFKLKVHGEVHAIGDGTRRRDDGTFEALPADHGYLICAQLGTFGWAAPESGFRRHLNVFARYAKGLAAFDELVAPTTFGSDRKTTRASELSFAASGNFDATFGNVMFGALSRRFVDADDNTADQDDGWEYAIDARPLARVVPELFAGADVSYQARFPRGLNPNTERAEDPAVFQVAPMLVYSPMGPSAYDRPQLRLVYRAAHSNQAALDLFVPDDPRHGHAWTHFVGVQAEWWFNSSTYR